MRLYIVRHAAAVERDDPACPVDADRPLTDEGRKRCRRMTEKLAARGFAPKIIATSPFLRARQTAEIMAKQIVGGCEVVAVDALKPDGRFEDVLHWNERRKEKEIAWVGHMPDLGHMTAALIGGTASRIGFSKGAVAALDFEDYPAEGRGILCWLATAKLLGC